MKKNDYNDIREEYFDYRDFVALNFNNEYEHLIKHISDKLSMPRSDVMKNMEKII